ERQSLWRHRADPGRRARPCRNRPHADCRGCRGRPCQPARVDRVARGDHPRRWRFLASTDRRPANRCRRRCESARRRGRYAPATRAPSGLQRDRTGTRGRWRAIEGKAMTDATERFLREAIALARANAERGGRPFGALVVKDGAVVATGVNEILATGDPTAHAELNALRAASHALGSPDLGGCTVFASGHPCPMCMAAMRISGVREVAYAYSNED